MLLAVAALSMGIDGCEGQPKVGNATCLGCHDGRTAADKQEFLDSAHNVIDCEDCHGAGFLHVRTAGSAALIRNPADDPRASNTAFCQTCHEDQAAGFLEIAHSVNEAVICIDCHDVHREAALQVTADSVRAGEDAVYAELCGQCHQTQLDGFEQSRHAFFQVASCSDCHDMHASGGLALSAINNDMCLQCHETGPRGFATVESIDAHTGFFHPVDPAGTGASRCTACHLPPLSRFDQDSGAHNHTFETIPPQSTIDAIDSGVEPVPPNSCAGISGCHDAAVPGSGFPRDLTDRALNESLQLLYEAIGVRPGS